MQGHNCHCQWDNDNSKTLKRILMLSRLHIKFLTRFCDNIFNNCKSTRKIWFESCTSFRSFISAPFMDVITTISTSEEKSKQIIEIIVNKDNLFSSLNLSQSLPQTCSGSPKKTVTNIARGGSGIIIFFKFMGVRINSSGGRIHFNSN